MEGSFSFSLEEQNEAAGEPATERGLRVSPPPTLWSGRGSGSGIGSTEMVERTSLDDCHQRGNDDVIRARFGTDEAGFGKGDGGKGPSSARGMGAI